MITYLGVCLSEYLVDILKNATWRNLYILDFQGQSGAQPQKIGTSGRPLGGILVFASRTTGASLAGEAWTTSDHTAGQFCGR